VFAPRPAPAAPQLDVGGRYRTARALSRIGTLLTIVAWIALFVTPRSDARSAARRSSSRRAHDPQTIFHQGEAALASGDLDTAERCFKQVASLDPRVAGAYANLGVIQMRRKKWDAAIASLEHASRLAPQISGIRLNIGLAFYRHGDYRHAIPAFESVVKQEPGSLQARYLLGQCYFFTDRYVEAVDALESLWSQQSRDLNYLYVLTTSANQADRKELAERALARMAEVGEDSALVHMLLGKAMLNLESFDDAAKELNTAVEADPKLPFVHFNLGLLYSKRGDYPKAREEFEKDIALEPDVVFNYDELGNICFLESHDAAAEKNYRKALSLDVRIINSHLGLAKVYERRAEYQKALNELDQAGKLDPQASRIHYLRGQTLVHMGRKAEGRKELEASVQLSGAQRDKRQKELEGTSVPSPELTQDNR
jgi:tetratricopeptide (TPR) repeat protein